MYCLTLQVSQQISDKYELQQHSCLYLCLVNLMQISLVANTYSEPDREGNSGKVMLV